MSLRLPPSTRPSSHPAIDGCSVLLSRRLSSAGAKKTLNESDKLFRWTIMSGFWLRGTTVFLFPARHMSWCSSRNERYLGELRVLLKGQRCAAPCFAWRRELRTVHNMRQLIKSEILKKKTVQEFLTADLIRLHNVNSENNVAALMPSWPIFRIRPVHWP